MKTIDTETLKTLLKKLKGGWLVLVKIKIEKSLSNIRNIINSANFQIVKDNYDILITDKIPSFKSNREKHFIIVWERHNVAELESCINQGSLKFLRGVFLKSQLKEKDYKEQFIKTLGEVSDEIKRINDLKEKANKVKRDSSDCIEIGSIVNIESKDRTKMADLYSTPRFTTLFIDKPMFTMMLKIQRIFEEMEKGINDLCNHYKDMISQINSGKILTKNKFNPGLTKTLNSIRQTNPVRFEPVLLTGDTGVGKTLIAKWIHGGEDNKGKKQRFPGSFQNINSSGFTPELLESELFGHVKGAFTDAHTDKPGKALLALGGVLFLDEIGDMPLSVQAKVLKFIDENTFYPLGWKEQEPIYTPLLIVAATNKDLQGEIKEGRFRRDLYARFTHRIYVPSIEERKGSLEALVDFILQNSDIGKDIKYISKEAIEKLKKQTYEENWRELERVVKESAYRTQLYGLDIILPELVE